MHVKTTIPYLETFKIRNKSQLEFAESLQSQLEKFWFGKENDNRKKKACQKTHACISTTMRANDVFLVHHIDI